MSNYQKEMDYTLFEGPREGGNPSSKPLPHSPSLHFLCTPRALLSSSVWGG